jgi:dTDP-L-rhamnose 4-epimerase
MKSKSTKRVLVTGGLGLVGSHVVDLLEESGYDVTILDCSEKEPCGSEAVAPRTDYVTPAARFIRGDILDRRLLGKILPQVDAVIHLSALVGVENSMHEIYGYVNTNTLGTAVLLDTLVNTPNSIKKLIIASSVGIYGEGKYYCSPCSSIVYPVPRTLTQLCERQWNHSCPMCGVLLNHLPINEQDPPAPTSIYAMSKLHQEEMALLIGKIHEIPTVVLRLSNVYGLRRVPSKQYSNVCEMFLNLILNGKSPCLFEDGEQLRDFIDVRDVAKATLLALEWGNADCTHVNVASGRSTSVLELAKNLIELCGVSMKPHVSGEFRRGDIRHCCVNVTRAKGLLDFEPEIRLKEGLKCLVESAQKSQKGS